MAGKFDLQKIINDVKAMVTPASIPEASKDDPVAYYLSELNKLTKELAESHTKQADLIAKINPILGNLYQELKGPGQAEAPQAASQPPEAPKPDAPKEEAAKPSGEETPCCGDTGGEGAKTEEKKE